MIIQDIDIPSEWTRGWAFGREAVFAARRAAIVSPRRGEEEYEIYRMEGDVMLARSGPVAKVADFKAACTAVELLFPKR